MENLVILTWISNKQSQLYIYIIILLVVLYVFLWKMFYFEEDTGLQVFYSPFTIYVLAEIFSRYHPVYNEHRQDYIVM